MRVVSNFIVFGIALSESAHIAPQARITLSIMRSAPGNILLKKRDFLGDLEKAVLYPGIRQALGDFRKCAHQTAYAGSRPITPAVNNLHTQLMAG